MARRLMPLGGALPRRRLVFALLVIVVSIIHAWVTRSVAERMEVFEAAAKAPPRIEVAYVRELEPEAPPATAPAPPARPAKSHRAAHRAVAPHAASAADLPASDAPAEPEAAIAEAASSPASAASEAMVADASASAAEASASQPERAVAEAASASDAAPATFEWPVSTRVSYGLDGNYRGQVQGEAQVEWIRAGSHYQVHLDLVIGPSFAPLISRRMTSDGEIGTDGLVPRRFDQDTRIAFADPRHAGMSFDETTVVLANGNRHDTLPGIQDMASQFIQMTYLFTTQPGLLRVGGHFELALGLPNRVDRWTYDVLDEDTVYTTFGPLPVLHVKPRPGPFRPGDLVPEIWFAPQLRYLPVRIRIQQDATANFIDLVIARRPELAAK